MSRRKTQESGDDSGAELPATPAASPARARGNDAALALPAAITQTLARIDEAEDLLASGIPRRRVASTIAHQWGIGRRQAQDYVRYVYDRWRNEGAEESRDDKRVRMRAMIEHTYAAAMKRRKALTVGDGEGVQHVEYVDEPDLRTAHGLLELMCRFEGLLEQPGTSAAGTIAEFITAMHAHYYGGMPAEVQGNVIEASTEGDE